MKNKDLKDFLADKDNKGSVEYGVMPDKLDYRKLFGLFFAGILLVVVLIYFAMVLFSYYTFKATQAKAESAVFYELEDIRSRDHEMLTTFGVVDEENNVFRIPVDSAITLVVEEYNN